MKFQIPGTNTKGTLLGADIDTAKAEELLIDRDKDGFHLRVLSSETINSKLTREEQLIFMARNGIYVLPTLELVDMLQMFIPDMSKTIEIGAGNGALARELGIKATDSFMQDPHFNPPNDMRAMWMAFMEACARSGNAPVRYGPNVLKCEGMEAIKRFKPQTVLGCFITHRYDERYPHLGGSVFGIPGEKLLEKVERYIMIGNLHTHAMNPLMKKEHLQGPIPGLITRSTEPSLDRIFVWPGAKYQGAYGLEALLERNRQQ